MSREELRDSLIHLHVRELMISGVAEQAARSLADRMVGMTFDLLAEFDGNIKPTSPSEHYLKSIAESLHGLSLTAAHLVNRSGDIYVELKTMREQVQRGISMDISLDHPEFAEANGHESAS